MKNWRFQVPTLGLQSWVQGQVWVDTKDKVSATDLYPDRLRQDPPGKHKAKPSRTLSDLCFSALSAAAVSTAPQMKQEKTTPSRTFYHEIMVSSSIYLGRYNRED